MTAVARQERFPTPCVADAVGGRTTKGSDRQGEAGLAVTVKREQFATPPAQDAKNNAAPSQHERNSAALNVQAGGALNPDFVCWLMGWPRGWDSIEPLPVDPDWPDPDLWAAEWEGVPRVATGVPDRVNRLKMLGNGWVPQVAMWVAGRIGAAEMVGVGILGTPMV